MAHAPDTLPRIATIDERYLSYNVEMAEVIGGNFWKPYDAKTVAARASIVRQRPHVSAIALGMDMRARIESDGGSAAHEAPG